MIHTYTRAHARTYTTDCAFSPAPRPPHGRLLPDQLRHALAAGSRPARHALVDGGGLAGTGRPLLCSTLLCSAHLCPALPSLPLIPLSLWRAQLDPKRLVDRGEGGATEAKAAAQK